MYWIIGTWLSQVLCKLISPLSCSMPTAWCVESQTVKLKVTTAGRQCLGLALLPWLITDLAQLANIWLPWTLLC
ncbi:hypothetical protein Y1Q_0001812 [Alligator mississippiensis]|uniref:Uncharacterized protein n=1 Tax=Alligator mississippiensis TaxID=8496 RepID=A0A151ML02_ALLMI|nr:hypothetical protein Y1Q_0001812 [Alligator mississippiensis]